MAITRKINQTVSMKQPPLLHALKHACSGIKLAFKKEKNIKRHLLISILVIFAGYQLKLAVHEWTIILLGIGSVLTAEMLNTCVEDITDTLFPTIDAKAKTIKDISAGAVLILSVTMAIIGCMIFIPKLLSFQSLLG